MLGFRLATVGAGARLGEARLGFRLATVTNHGEAAHSEALALHYGPQVGLAVFQLISCS